MKSNINELITKYEIISKKIKKLIYQILLEHYKLTYLKEIINTTLK